MCKLYLKFLGPVHLLQIQILKLIQEPFYHLKSNKIWLEFIFHVPSMAMCAGTFALACF